MAAPPERLRLRFVVNSAKKQAELDELARKKEERDNAKNKAVSTAEGTAEGTAESKAESKAKEFAFLMAGAKKLTAVDGYKPPIIDSDSEPISKSVSKSDFGSKTDFESKSRLSTLRLLGEIACRRPVEWNENDKEGCHITAARSRGIECLMSLLPGFIKTTNEERARYSVITDKTYIFGKSATFTYYLKRDGVDIAEFTGYFSVKNAEASEVKLVKLIH